MLTVHHLGRSQSERIVWLCEELGLPYSTAHDVPQVRAADGDARTALNVLELAVSTAVPDDDGRRRVDAAAMRQAFARKALLYDKSGEEHFNLISALHKSIRNSDADAGLYWLARMLEGGEDPLYVARRLVRFASEDVGLADSQALVLALAAQQAVHFVGLPEGALALAQLVRRCVMTHIITQNIDNLHQNSGVPDDRVIELHGNNSYARCLGCHTRYEIDPIREAFLRDETLPICDQCGGMIKTATISFGQSMPEDEMRRAQDAVLACDLMLVAGSSLVVFPAAGFPAMAKQNGAKLVIDDVSLAVLVPTAVNLLDGVGVARSS